MEQVHKAQQELLAEVVEGLVGPIQLMQQTEQMVKAAVAVEVLLNPHLQEQPVMVDQE